MGQPPATSYDEIKDVLEVKAKRSISRDKVLVTVRSMKSELKIQKGKDVSTSTVRDYGISIDGYFRKKYSSVFDYQKDGKPENWGLIMKPEKYLREVRGFTDDEIEELKQKAEEEKTVFHNG